MAIISPLKKIFNWQTASEKIPYKVYTAYVTVDGSENMYAKQVLENTLGAVKFETVSTGIWRIVLPFNVPRLKIMIPGFGDYWYDNTSVVTSGNSSGNYRFNIFPGYGVAPPYNCSEQECITNHVEIQTFDVTAANISWSSFFNGVPGPGDQTAYPIEIRVYN